MLIRVKTNLKAYKKTKTGWQPLNKRFPELEVVVNLFRAAGKFDYLIDKIDSQFLKGQIEDGNERGARINILPNGKKLEKAYSLFSKHLRIHDQTTEDHWDVLYQNRGGTWSYIYTLEKREQHRNRKYKKVDLLEKRYRKLVSSVNAGLLDDKDKMALPMYTLLHTHMRVGNEIYYRANGHKGLTTLTKGDVKVKNNEVSFNYIGKDGVPNLMIKRFSTDYINRLKQVLNGKRSNEFLFTSNGRILKENDFKKAFLKYCGYPFYPHIIRSYYATTQVKKFLKSKKNTKAQVEKLFMSIAKELGHKRFDKKNKVWREHYAVTVNSYIPPALIKKCNLYK